MSIGETSIAKNLGLRLYHLSPGIGTEVLDIDLSKDLGVDVIGDIHDAEQRVGGQMPATHNPQFVA